ncbi:uncharacterized protein LOC127080359 [Lathyrus oleraceus]|uniref:uncharacterized protein LOC127080359 n=1 Tax=Pisum sativum TaxID=3888 RepID=UPI0021CE51AE|nr:uncharacterized protein LOC127080359 [Pisum sativum]
MEEDGLLEVDLEIKETKDQDEEVALPPVKEKEKVMKPTIKLPYPPRQKKKYQHEKKIESVILQGMKIPVKKKDRGSVTIPCTIGDRKFKKALTNLGASVSLMPLSIYKKLGIGTVQDTRMTLQFADHSVRRPYGIMEDVLVKIDKFVFPVDFVILEMPEDEEIPLILGRPFLETGRCVIDIEEGTITLKVYDEELKIDIQNIMQYKDDIGTSHTVEIIDQVIAQEIEKQMPQSSLERVLSLSIFESDEDEGDFEVLAMMEKQPKWIGCKSRRWEDLRPPPPDITKEPKTRENLKQLPANLKYVFLDTGKKMPIDYQCQSTKCPRSRNHSSAKKIQGCNRMGNRGFERYKLDSLHAKDLNGR